MKKKRRVLALFVSIFLRNRSLSDARWFCGKKHKIGKGNLYLTENRLSWNEMCCAADKHNYMCDTCVINWYSVSITLCTTKLFCRVPSLDPWPETCPVFWCFCFLKTSVIKLINTNLSGVQIRVYSTLDHIIVLRTIFSEDNYNVKRTWS